MSEFRDTYVSQLFAELVVEFSKPLPSNRGLKRPRPVRAPAAPRDDDSVESKREAFRRFVVSNKRGLEEDVQASIERVEKAYIPLYKSNASDYRSEILGKTPDSELEKKLESTLEAYSDSDVLFSRYNVDFLVKDLRTLSFGAWLNDEVVNMKMEMLREHYPNNYYQSSFFYSKLMEDSDDEIAYGNVRRWTTRGRKKADVFSKKRLFFPINSSNVHWTLVVIFVEERKITHFDSMGVSNSKICANFKAWFEQEHLNKKKTPLDWELEIVAQPDALPQQNNCDDCGVFLCTFADILSREESKPLQLEWIFSASDVGRVRGRLVESLLENELYF